MRKVCPSAVVAPISCTSCVGDVLGGVEVVGAVAVVHEQHVDVGRVRQLGATEPAHADHGERHGGSSAAERGLEARLGQAR